MTDRVLEQFTQRVLASSLPRGVPAPRRPGESALQLHQPLADAPEPSLAEEFPCFGVLRGVRERAIYLELRKKDGAITAIAYAGIERLDFDPSVGITLHALGRAIRITGRNLNGEARPGLRLFQSLTRHRATWIGEAGREAHSTDQEGQPVIERIET